MAHTQNQEKPLKEDSGRKDIPGDLPNVDVEYCKNLEEIKKTSEKDFEKNITFIAAGALALTLTFIQKIIDIPKAHSLWMLFTSWLFMTTTLISNLCGHCYSMKVIDVLMEEFASKGTRLKEKWHKHAYRISIWNIINIVLLLIGILLFLLFIMLNHTVLHNSNSA